MRLIKRTTIRSSCLQTLTAMLGAVLSFKMHGLPLLWTLSYDIDGTVPTLYVNGIKPGIVYGTTTCDELHTMVRDKCGLTFQRDRCGA